MEPDHNGDSVGTATAKKESRLKVRGWPGYVRAGVFVIEKKINGQKFHVSTRCTTLRAALKELGRFELDPAGYRPGGIQRRDALVLTEKLIDSFHEWHLTQVTRPWALDVHGLLVDWANHLKGADLRELSLVRHVEPHLEGATQRHHRVSALKAFMKWARKTELIRRAEDVTLDLQVPPSTAAEEPRDMDWALVVETFPHLPPLLRDVVQVLSATGWHLSELRRFAADGQLHERMPTDAPEVQGRIGVVPKAAVNKKRTRKKHFTVLLHEEHWAAAKRIRARGYLIDRGALRKHLLKARDAVTAERRKKAPDAPEAPLLKLGAFRHSVSTWLAEQGLSPDQVAQFVGHTSSATTSRHYINQLRGALVLPKTALRVVS